MSARQKPSMLTACICACHQTLLPTTLTSFGQIIPQPAGCSLSDVDEEMERCRARMRALRRLRNSLLPVSRLPPEVLCQVFGYIVPGLATPSRDSRPAKWLQFSQVCQYWRQTALGCPALWTCPPLLHPILVEELLHRSQQLPIHIRTGPAYFAETDHAADPPRGLLSALLHLHRIQTLRIDASADAVQDLIVPALSHHAPLLESLTISTDEELELDLSLFLGAAPRLRRLSLSGIPMAWSAPVFRTITHLTLSSDIVTISMPWPMFFDGLEGLSQLIALDMSSALPNEDPTSLSGRQVHLPRLQKLWIDDEDMVVFLSHIPWKACPGLRLYAIYHGGWYIGLDASPVFSLLFQFDYESGFNAPRWMCFRGSREWFTLQLGLGDRPHDCPRLYLSFPHRHDTFEVSELTPLRSDWSNSLGTLSISADLDFFPKSSWLSVFSAFKNTHTIHVAGTAVASLLDALEEDSTREVHEIGPPLPALRRVYIHPPLSQPLSIQASLRRVFSARDKLQLPSVELHHWGPPGDITSVSGVDKVVVDVDDHNQYLERDDWSDDEL